MSTKIAKILKPIQPGKIAGILSLLLIMGLYSCVSYTFSGASIPKEAKTASIKNISKQCIIGESISEQPIYRSSKN